MLASAGRDSADFTSVTFVLFSLLRGETLWEVNSEENFLTSSDMRGDMRLFDSLGETGGVLTGESVSTFNTFAHFNELKLVLPNSGSSTTGNDSADHSLVLNTQHIATRTRHNGVLC